ncbi:MAG: DUF4188 domain-containing protein [Chloroflexota bacterium]|nr:DUF4188 domain-containing protein [Chloroflexota bacterium]
MSDSNAIQAGRYRADFPAGTVVFLIGMRVNALWRVRDWLPVFIAMPRMLRELARQPELGLLEARTEVAWRRATVIQYWESMDKLMAYAAARNREHLPAWKAYNASVKRSGAVVGVWHEAYEVHPATSHIVYRNMPPFGMTAATRGAPANQLLDPSVRSDPET